MKLLICTQAVDRNDPVLGFFHRWIEEFAKRCEQVTVICLREGEHNMPGNVRVYSLGKEVQKKGEAFYLKGLAFFPRLRYALRFLGYLWQMRHEYDAVFVHMNPEYILLGGAWWRLAGKKVALWYVHKSVDLKLRIAEKFASVIFTASPESFRLRTNKLKIVGHGIDTDFFSPDQGESRGQALISVGRLMPSKRHDLAIEAAALAYREIRIIGDGAERGRLESLARERAANAHFLGGINQMQLRDEYRRAAYFIHTSETGSLDKVVLEALACDTPVITTSEALGRLPIQKVAPTPEAIAAAVGEGPEAIDRPTRVREQHSLQALIPKILSELA